MPIEYCYPTGICQLSDLANGQTGFLLQGEEPDDDSG